LVPGGVLPLSGGGTLAADWRIPESKDLPVFEAALTGESLSAWMTRR